MHVHAVWIIGVLTATWVVGLAMAEGEHSTVAGATNVEVVARVNDTVLFGDELDQELALSLYDLDLARYRLRLQGLRDLIQRRFPQHPDILQQVTITLERPTPPRLPISPQSGFLRGSPEAPVELVVFCSFQSQECARLQPLLRELLEQFEDRLSLLIRDFPSPDDSSAIELAEAARCAAEQIDYWDYHDALYSRSLEGTPEALEQISDTLGLDNALLASCMQSRRHRSAVEASIAYAHSLGLGTVPVSFINGFYLPGLADIQEFRALIDSELFRLSHPGSGKTAPQAIAQAKPSQLPLLLTGVVTRSGSGGGSAVILPRDSDGGAVTYRPGDVLMPGVTLIRVARNRVYLRNEGQLEYLMLTRGPSPILSIPVGLEKDMDMEPPSGDDELTRAVEAFSLPNPDAVFELTREQVQEALLTSDLGGSELEGVVIAQDAPLLLRVASVEPGGIYELLDLQSGDVLIEVNGEPIHSGGDLLRRALEDEPQVDLAILREDLEPRRFIYNLE